MSLTTLGEVPRSVFFRFSRVAVAKISDQLTFQLCSEKNDSWSRRGLCLIAFFFLRRKLKNELRIVRNSRNCDNRETGSWFGYLSESSQTHSEKSSGSISSLYGAKTNLKAEKNLFATPKKKSRIANGLTTQTEGVRSKIRLVSGTNYCTTT